MSARKHVFFFLCPYIWLDTRPGPKWNVFIWLTPWSVFDVNKWVSVVLVDIRPEDSQSGSSYCLIPNQNIYLTQTQSPCKNTYNFVVIQGAGIEPSVLHGQFNGCYDSSTITWLLPFFPPLCLLILIHICLLLHFKWLLYFLTAFMTRCIICLNWTLFICRIIHTGGACMSKYINYTLFLVSVQFCGTLEDS